MKPKPEPKRLARLIADYVEAAIEDAVSKHEYEYHSGTDFRTWTAPEALAALDQALSPKPSKKRASRGGTPRRARK